MVWVEDGEIREQAHGHDPQTTNNRMELTALIAAFRTLPEDAEAVVYTDSRLCVDTITKWAPGWERKGWTRKGDPLKNLDLIKELLALFRGRPHCKLEWIAAHTGYRWNEYADSLASAWRREEL
jgi:ribonuclease HI